MFFILSKILHIFLAPFSWFLITFGIFLFSKSKIWKKRMMISSIVILLFFTNTVVLKEFIRLWEIPATDNNHVEQFDVGIVLGGMFEYDNSANRLSIRRGGDRIWQALTLYHEGKVKKLLLSGDSGYITDRGLHESVQLKAVLIKHGIPEKNILIDSISRNTYENAKESVEILKSKQLNEQNILLITSAMHMRRARACFTKQGVFCVPYATDQYTGGARHYHFDEYFLPNVDTMSTWHSLIKEWVGMIMYKLIGYA